MTAPYLNIAMNPICDHFVAARKFSCDSCWEPFLQATLWRGLILATILFTPVTVQTNTYLRLHSTCPFFLCFLSFLSFFSFYSHIICLSNQLLLLSSCVPMITCLSSLGTNNRLHLSWGALLNIQLSLGAVFIWLKITLDFNCCGFSFNAYDDWMHMHAYLHACICAHAHICLRLSTLLQFRVALSLGTETGLRSLVIFLCWPQFPGCSCRNVHKHAHTPETLIPRQFELKKTN